MSVILDADQRELVFPIVKSAQSRGGDLLVTGICTNDAVDRDLERIDMDSSREWLTRWMDTGANIRMAHDPQRPIGKGVRLDFEPAGHFLTSVIVAKDAKKLALRGVLRAYSVGVIRPAFKSDPSGQASRIITSRPDGLTEVAEVSLVDRPSNPHCDITILQKAQAQADQFITKAAALGQPGMTPKARRAAERSALSAVAGKPVRTREQALRALVRADLDSTDPERREAARQIIAARWV